MYINLFIAVFLVCTVSLTCINGEFDHDNYTPQEKEGLKKLRPAIENIVHHDYQKQDEYLIGFLRAKNLKVDQAKEMITKTMEWRKNNKVDTIMNEPEMRALLKTFPLNLGDAVDRKGRPALQCAFGAWDIRKFMLAGGKDQLRRYQVFYFETMVTKARELGKSQWIFFVDMNGYNLKQHACLACVPFFVDLVTQYESYYPNTAAHILLPNTPRIFEGVLNLIKPLMAPATKRDMQIFGTNKEEWQRVVLTIFPPEQLTPLYGGTRKA